MESGVGLIGLLPAHRLDVDGFILGFAFAFAR